MKFFKVLSFATAVSVSTMGQAALIDFQDNGLITTETRADGSVWEWLDLTVTTNIASTSILSDVADDGDLNFSTGPYLGLFGPIADLGLTAELSAGWSVASDIQVGAMFNSFFERTFEDRRTFSFNAESPLVDTYLDYFGDSMAKGFADLLFPIPPNARLASCGASLASSSSGALDAFRLGCVNDGDLVTSNNFDTIDLNVAGVAGNFADPTFGTFLVRERELVSSGDTQVSAPAAGA